MRKHQLPHRIEDIKKSYKEIVYDTFKVQLKTTTPQSNLVIDAKYSHEPPHRVLLNDFDWEQKYNPKELNRIMEWQYKNEHLDKNTLVFKNRDDSNFYQYAWYNFLLLASHISKPNGTGAIHILNTNYEPSWASYRYLMMLHKHVLETMWQRRVSIHDIMLTKMKKPKSLHIKPKDGLYTIHSDINTSDSIRHVIKNISKPIDVAMIVNIIDLNTDPNPFFMFHPYFEMRYTKAFLTTLILLLATQKIGGSASVYASSITTQPMIDMICILQTYYHTVEMLYIPSIMKSNMRIGLHILCNGFKGGVAPDIIQSLLHILETVQPDQYITQILKPYNQEETLRCIRHISEKALKRSVRICRLYSNIISVFDQRLKAFLDQEKLQFWVNHKQIQEIQRLLLQNKDIQNHKLKIYQKYRKYKHLRRQIQNNDEEWAYYRNKTQKYTKILQSFLSTSYCFIDENNNRVSNIFNEVDEQFLVTCVIEPEDVVLEIGARYGTVSCAINKQLADQTKQVSVEPDPTVWNALEVNKRNNHCEYHIFKGVISKKKKTIVKSGYGTTTKDDPLSSIPNLTFDELQKKYKLEFNVLVVDCEGCLEGLLDENPGILDNMRLVMFEQDRPDICDYNRVIVQLEGRGFRPIVTGFQSVWKKN